MTTQEFSNEFDLLINDKSSVNTFGNTASYTSFDEYEKSVLLTLAQEEIVKELYRGSLEGSEEFRRGLDKLIKTSYPKEVTNYKGLDRKSTFFELDKDVWFITYESVELLEGAYCENNPVVRVIPMRQDEWHRSKDNPFKRPNKRKVVRLDNGGNTIELISDYPLKNYLIRYLSKPSPIILTSLEGDLSIDNIQTITECKLNTALHRLILERAVLLGRSRMPSQSSK